MLNVAAGIDIGGTDSEIGLVDETGKCIEKRIIITTAFPHVEDFVAECTKAIKDLCGSRYHLKAIGVAAPNGNHYKGTIDHAVNLTWKGIIPFTDMVKNHFDVPVKLTNDANAAAIGEKKFGAAKQMNDFVLVTLGTGLGSGIYTGGRLLTGHLGLAGEMGHMIVEDEGRMCNTQRRGCLEAYASVTGLRRTVSDLLARSNEPSSLRNIPFSQLTGKQIYEAAKKGEPLALEAYDYTGYVLGRALANVVAILDTEAVILAGGLAWSGDLILTPTAKYMNEVIFPAFQGKVKVLLSELRHENAGVPGAAALALD